MGRKTNWWLDGWRYEEQLGENAGRRRKLVYEGEYYSLGRDAPRLPALKLAFTGLTLAETAAYVLTSALAEPGAARIFVGACILVIIPLMYLLIGTGCLWAAKDPMTYRDYRGSILRIRWTSIAIAALNAIGAVGEIIRLIAPGQTPVTVSEKWWLTGTLFCCAAAIGIALLQHRYHPRMQPKDLQ